MVAMSSSELRTFSSVPQQKGVARRQWRRQRLPAVQFEAPALPVERNVHDNNSAVMRPGNGA